MYTPREKLTLAASLVFAVIAVGAALALSCGWLASGGDRYPLFGKTSYIDNAGFPAAATGGAHARSR